MMGTGGDHASDPGVPGEHGGHIRLSWRVASEGLAVVTIRGELDLATADQAVRYVSEVIDRHDGPVSVDLSGLAFCDACGLGALIRMAAYAERSARRIGFARPSPSVTRIMRITGVNGRLQATALAPTSAR
jgi:anti-sigma B factor antagonist